MLVAIDVDSTLYDSAGLFARVAAEHFDLFLPENATNWHDYYQYAKVETLIKVFRKSHSKEYVEQNVPYPDAANVCQMIFDKGHKIYYVSDRHPQARSALRNWINAHGFRPQGDLGRMYDTYGDDYVVVGKDKREWLTNNQPDIVIDDRVRTMFHARDFGAIVFSLAHSWNINLKGEVEGINIFQTWEAIGQEIEKII